MGCLATSVLWPFSAREASLGLSLVAELEAEKAATITPFRKTMTSASVYTAGKDSFYEDLDFFEL